MMHETLLGINLQSSESTFKHEDCGQVDVLWTEAPVEVCLYGSGGRQKH